MARRHGVDRVFVSVNGYRVLLSRRVLRQSQSPGAAPPDARVLRWFLAFALTNGLWLGALSLAFFEALDDALEEDET